MTIPALDLPYATITGSFVSISYDGADEDLTPDVQPLSGTLTLTPTVTAGRIDDTLAQILTVTVRIFGGQIVDAQEQPGVRILATDADIGITDWAWRASFTLDTGLQVQPITFLAPTGETVSLTSGLIPVTSAPYQLVQGTPGRGIASLVITGSTLTVTFTDGTTQDLTITEADTGWQTIAGSGSGAASGSSFKLRRIGRTVLCDLRGMVLSATPTSSWGAIPTGYTAPADIRRQADATASGVTSTSVDVVLFNGTTAYVRPTAQATAGLALDGVIEWTTLDLFPA